MTIRQLITQTNEQLLVGTLSTIKHVIQYKIENDMETTSEFDEFLQNRIDYIQDVLDDVNKERQIKEQNVILTESFLCGKLNFKPSHEQILGYAEQNNLVLTDYAKIILIENKNKSRPYWRFVVPYKSLSKQHELALELTQHFRNTGQMK
jgi:hypothetical protein